MRFATSPLTVGELAAIQAVGRDLSALVDVVVRRSIEPKLTREQVLEMLPGEFIAAAQAMMAATDEHHRLTELLSGVDLTGKPCAD